MTSRERVLAAAARRRPDRVPFHMSLTPFIVQRLKDERGAADPQDFLGMDLRHAPYHAVPESIDFSRYASEYPPGTNVDIWGCGTFPVGYYHFTKAVSPMERFTALEEVRDYPFPAREPVVDEIRKEVDAIRARGLAAVSQYECGTFEQAHALMGMESLLANMYVNPDMVRLLFDRVTDVKARMAEAYVKADVDVLFIGDDIGIQQGPIMDPKMWREFLLPPLEKITSRARSVRPDIPIAYHSCGHIHFAVEGLIEAGIDILQSVQPEANNLERIADEYGDRIAFWGGVGSQSTMSGGTPDDVKAEVKRCMDTLGRNGGLILGPAHFVEPESPLENIDAFLEAIEEYGYYD